MQIVDLNLINFAGEYSVQPSVQIISYSTTVNWYNVFAVHDPLWQANLQAVQCEHLFVSEGLY